MERKVYELSGNLTQANKDQAVEVTLGSDVDRIAGPATLNVVRVRCPSQFVGVGTGTVTIGSSGAVAVEPYSSPSEAISNYEKAFRIAAFKMGGDISQNPTSATKKFTFYQLNNDTAKVVFTLPDNTEYQIEHPPIGSKISAVPGLGHFPIPNFPLGTTATAVFAGGSTGTLTAKSLPFTTLPTITLEDGVLKVTTDLDFTLDAVAAERLNLGPKTSGSTMFYKGTKEPAFNDVRRIVMTLTPDTQKVIAKDASDPQGTLYNNASISFTVDDDPTNNSAYAAYSLDGDFQTNSLRLKNGAADTLSFHLQRCVYDRTTGKLGRPEALDLPYANNFVEVKIVADKKKRLFGK